MSETTSSNQLSTMETLEKFLKTIENFFEDIITTFNKSKTIGKVIIIAIIVLVITNLPSILSFISHPSLNTQSTSGNFLFDTVNFAQKMMN